MPKIDTTISKALLGQIQDKKIQQLFDQILQQIKELDRRTS